MAMKQKKKSIKKKMKEDQKKLSHNLFYFNKHTWAMIKSENTALIGLTDYALKQLKGLSKIYTDKIGDIVRRIEPFGVAETWMYMFDLYSPIAGIIVSVNSNILDNVENINANTWLIQVKPISYNALIKELEVLMDEKKYEKHIAKLESRITTFPEVHKVLKVNSN